MRPVCVIIRDGWGINDNPVYNAVAAANTKNIDDLKAKYPWSVLQTSGEAVGLPDGFQGSSEVGHLNMGAGRIVVQELKRIDEGFKDGTLYQSEKWAQVIDNWKKNNSQLHFFGLLQDEGVHAHMNHLFTMMREARKEYPDGKIVIHPFLDGRDTPPKSCELYIFELKKVMKEIGSCMIGTAMGRFYAMDRGENWDITDQAYNCIVSAEGRYADTIEEAVKNSYKNDRTPDGTEMVDEYILPHVIGDYQGVYDGDSIIHTNYRQDRAIQMTKAFVDPNYPGTLQEKPKVVYVGFTQYYDEFENFMLGSMSSGGGMNNLLGEVLAKAGKKQLRIAETQKFRHVTSFFNGKSTTPYENETQMEIKSKIDPATFASFPAMEAYTVTEKLLEILQENPYDVIIVNFANCDMVGHTGNFDAAKKAVEVVDECVGKVVARLLQLDAHILITADHGNAEQMVNYESGLVQTSHTLYPVECIYVAKDAPGKKLQDGILADIAPTVLKLAGVEVPKEMTAKVLIDD
ncbi:MAG: 2,3-bisphosphoglycerate-independent phosphoglycerate mutase [Candidatus Marinimicrobia bacterium]|nr:2,3-bisphosphoglycerate-independent phosphoglycerate mutase [Candidatus Neomarinimicrobiota bacterium]